MISRFTKNLEKEIWRYSFSLGDEEDTLVSDAIGAMRVNFGISVARSNAISQALENQLNEYLDSAELPTEIKSNLNRAAYGSSAGRLVVLYLDKTKVKKFIQLVGQQLKTTPNVSALFRFLIRSHFEPKLSKFNKLTNQRELLHKRKNFSMPKLNNNLKKRK